MIQDPGTDFRRIPRHLYSDNTPFSMETTVRHEYVRSRLDALLTNDTDWIAVLATVACELHAAFDHYHWTGFYRTTRPGHLQVGPYQGGHGCIDIAFGKGVCGTAAQEKKTQLVDDVHAFPGHIACSASTRSEVVVPIMNRNGNVVAVLDVDSDDASAFNQDDAEGLESLCAWLGERFAPQNP